MELHDLVKNNNYKAVKEFSGDINTTDENTDTALHIAVKKKCGKMIEILFEKKINIHIKNNQNLPAYQKNISENIAVIFIKNGLNPNTKYNKTLNFFQFFCKKFNVEMIKYCLENGAIVENEIEIIAEQKENIYELSKLFIHHGTNINYASDFLSIRFLTSDGEKFVVKYINKKFTPEEKLLCFAQKDYFSLYLQMLKLRPEIKKLFVEQHDEFFWTTYNKDFNIHYLFKKFDEYITPKKIAVGKIFQEKKCGILVSGKIVSFLYGGDETDNMRLMLENT